MDKVRAKVSHIIIKPDDAGQRIDNFLFNKLKNVPKTHIYKVIRKGEVRVNSKRVKSFYKLLPGDQLRLPPVVTKSAEKMAPANETIALLKQRILFEDENLLIINKPSGMSVHAGSTVRMGVVEALKHAYPAYPNLELAHRLDSETSGCLILAKKKRVLRELHQLLREGQVKKIYWALTKGYWKKNEQKVELSLSKHFEEGGKHVVRVQETGKSALTLFKTLTKLDDASLVEVTLCTGRTHQIRVHASALHHPLAGDDRYGDADFNKLCRQKGLKRMFLHARMIEFILPSYTQSIKVVAPLDKQLENAIASFEKPKGLVK